MPDVPTFDAVYELGRAEVQSRRPALTDWNEGSANDAYVGAGAVMADEVIRVVVNGFAALFVDTAERSDLDDLALDRFNLTRIPEVASIGTLRFTRSSGVDRIEIPIGTRVQATVNGIVVVVETTVVGEIPASTSSGDVPAQCQDAGPSGNLEENTLTTILDAIPDDTQASVTNLERFAGGDVEETDPEFRARIRRYFQTLRKGTVPALQAGATSVPGVQFATIDESFIAEEDGGYVAVYIGDPDGNANSALAALVVTELDSGGPDASGWRAAGIAVQVFAAVREEHDLYIEVLHRSGIDATELRAALSAGLFGFSDRLPPGETMHLSAIESAAHQASLDVISATVVTVDGAAPAAITPIAPQNAVRISSTGLQFLLTEA